MTQLASVLHSGILVRNYAYTKVTKADLELLLSNLPWEVHAELEPGEYGGTYQGLSLRVKLTEIPDWFCLSVFSTERNYLDSHKYKDGPGSEFVGQLKQRLTDQVNLPPYALEVHSPEHLESILRKGSRNLSRSHLAPFMDVLTQSSTATQACYPYTRLKDGLQNQLSDITVKEKHEAERHPAVMEYAVCDKYEQFSHLQHFLKLRWFALELDFDLFQHIERELLFVPIALSKAIPQISDRAFRKYLNSLPDIQEILLDDESVSFFIITATAYIYYSESPFFEYL